MKTRNLENMKALQGIAVSPGIIKGKARLIDRSRVKILYQYLIENGQLNHEVDRFKAALKITEEQLGRLKSRMPEQVKAHSFGLVL